MYRQARATVKGVLRLPDAGRQDHHVQQDRVVWSSLMATILA